MLRFEVAQSLNTDLEVIQVSRMKTDETKSRSGEEWREEIKGMEQLLTSLASLKRSVSLWQRFFFTPPQLIFEIANPSSSEEIFFYLSVPKRFRESVEKQIHSFFPHAVVEKVSEYTIFSPTGHTAVAHLNLKESAALPLKPLS